MVSLTPRPPRHAYCRERPCLECRIDEAARYDAGIRSVGRCERCSHVRHIAEDCGYCQALSNCSHGETQP